MTLHLWTDPPESSGRQTFAVTWLHVSGETMTRLVSAVDRADAASIVQRLDLRVGSVVEVRTCFGVERFDTSIAVERVS